jgi:hypothetical protein
LDEVVSEPLSPFGKFVCGTDLLALKKGDCLGYSVGSFNQVDFEASVKEYLVKEYLVKEYLDCETHTFDPIIDTFVSDEYATFHQCWDLEKVEKMKAQRGLSKQP